MRAKSIILNLLICLSINLFGQELTRDFTLIKVEDGNEYLGTILEENEDFLTMKTKTFAELKIKKSAIKSREVVNSDQLHEGEYWFENPNATRNLFGPTGYGLRKGEGYYQNFLLAYNSVSYGFTDNFTLGVGLIPVIIDDAFFYSITPKVSIPVQENKLNIGGGLLFMGVAGEHFGIAYGVTTIGSRDKNFSFGLGYGFADGELADRPTITLSGMIRISKKFAFVTENWILSDFFLLTYGGRLIFEGISVDIGFANSGDTGLFLGIPIAGITVPFGNR